MVNTMPLARNYIPALRFGAKIRPQEILNSGMEIGRGRVYYVAAAALGGFGDFDADHPPHTDGTASVYNTIDAANNASDARDGYGDTALIVPGHTETFTAASGAVLDNTGMYFIGLGYGDNRPVFTFSTATGASILLSGNNVLMANVVGTASLDSVTSPFDLTGLNQTLDIEWQDQDVNTEAVTAVRLVDADGARIKLVYRGFTGGNAAVRAISINSCDDIWIEIDGFGIVSTAWVNFVTTASTNVTVRGTLFTQGITNFTRDVVDTIGGSSWNAHIFDASFGGWVSGGSGAALASDDVSAVAAQIGTMTNTGGTATLGAILGDFANTALVTRLNTIDDFIDTEVAAIATSTATTIPALHAVPTADVATNTNVRDVAGNKTDAAIADTIEGAAATTQSLVATNKAILQRIGADSANNTAATSLVVANSNGSLLERAEALQVAAAPTSNHPNYFTVTADMTSATWNTAAAHEIATVTGVVRMQILVEVTATVITVGTNGTIALGYEGNTSAIFSATALDAALTGDVFSAVYGSAATTPASGADAQSSLTHAIFDVVVVNGLDVGYTIATNAGTTGTLTFHVWWQPLSATGAVTAGAGGAL